MDSKLQQAIEAIKGGNKEDGRRLLIKVLHAEPENELAWLWLARAVEGERRKQALEKVLEINPSNTTAAQHLTEFQAREGSESQPDTEKEPKRKVPMILGVLAVAGALACIAGLVVLSLVTSQFTRVREALSSDPPLTESGEVAEEPTRRPRVSCPDDEVEIYLDELDLLMEEWDDTVVLAGSTSRISLAPVVRELQEIRRNARRIERPDCADYLHDMVIVAMDARIDTFVSFLSQESDSVVAREMDAADSVRNAVDEEIAAFREDALAAYLASETSATDLQEQSEVAQSFERPTSWTDVPLPTRDDLLVSFPSDWQHSIRGDRGQVLVVENAEETVVVSVSSSSETYLSDLESDSARLFSLQTVLETSDFDFYLERRAETGVYAQNRGYVVEFSRREESGDDIEDAIWAVIMTPQDDEVIVITHTTREDFAQIDLLILSEIYASIRRE